jgi:imidazoleglycerol phosphate synthase cyclase subunit/phosphoribosyl-ATP pyrophosphohydrolase
VGDILVLAERYRDEGADEVVFYDITASPEGRSVDRAWVRRVAQVLDIPFCVAGGIRSVEDAEAILNEGAEKVSINSPALTNPSLIEELATRFGSQCVVIGIDSANVAGGYKVFQFTGDPNRSRNTGRDTLAWVKEVQERGAGEIVLNCMTSDGVRRGYDVAQLGAVRDICDVPLVASGGAGALRERVREGARGRRARRKRVPFGSDRHSGSEDDAGGLGHRGAPVNAYAAFDAGKVDFGKSDGLVPAIVQDADTGAVLMLAYMNREALEQTLARRRAVFYSRSKQRLWEKGETTGHTLDVVDLALDCDADTLLVTARPRGPACHNGTLTCFGDEPRSAASTIAFLAKLEAVVAQRANEKPDASYTAKLLAKGLNKVAQKVGEEGVETALAGVNETDEKLTEESADLLFHLLVLLRARGISLQHVVRELERRHRQ